MASRANNWNRVTPLSKYLAMALFIILPFVGFYLGMQYERMITPDYPPTQYVPEPVNQTGNTTIEKDVEGSTCGGVKAELCPLNYTCKLKTAEVNAIGTCVKDNGMLTPAAPENDNRVM